MGELVLPQLQDMNLSSFLCFSAFSPYKMVAFFLFWQTWPCSFFMSQISDGGLLQVNGINYTINVHPEGNN